MRVLNTLYGLYALSIFAVVIFLLFAPLIILGPTLRIRRRCGRAAVLTAFALLGAPLRIQRHAPLPAGRCIVVTNHASYLDGILMTAALPSRYTFVVQDGAANWPVIGLIIRRMGVSFVSRSSARPAVAHAAAPAAACPAGKTRYGRPHGRTSAGSAASAPG